MNQGCQDIINVLVSDNDRDLTFKNMAATDDDPKLASNKV